MAWRPRAKSASVRCLGVLAAAVLAGCSSGNSDSFVWGRTPDVSRDGGTIVFCQNLSTPSDQLTYTVSVLDAGAVWKCNSSGGAAVRLTPPGRGPDFYPTISPDGTKLAFISGEGGQFDLWVSDVNGLNRHKLTYDAANDTMPCWHPNGQQLTWVSDRAGHSDLWQTNVDGSGQRQLGNFSSDQASPSYSPDGLHLVFSSNRDRGNFDIWTMDADGGNLVQLTRKDASASKVADGAPTWSPDGTHVAFARWSNKWDVYRVGSDGSGLLQLTHNAYHNGDPRYEPSGNLLYTSSASGWWQIWRMTGAGVSLGQVTGR